MEKFYSVKLELVFKKFMNRPQFYFEEGMKKKQKAPTEITKRQYNCTGNFKKKKTAICPVCQKEKDKLTTDHNGNEMCSVCFINSL